jgi:hypothetical protein
MFRSGKVLKVDFRRPAGVWADGVDFHKALRARLKAQAVDVLLPSPGAQPDADVRGVPELRWMGGGPCVQWYVPGRDPFADPPEVGGLVEAGRWLCLYLHVWVRQAPPRALVREVALSRVPATTLGREVPRVREDREAMESALIEELSRTAAPTLARCAVAIRDDGMVALSGPGDLRDRAMTAIREELAAVRGEALGKIWYEPVLPALSAEGGEDLLTELMGMMDSASRESEGGGLWLVARSDSGQQWVWDIRPGASLRLVSDAECEEQGSLTASGSLAAEMVTGWCRLREDHVRTPLARTEARRLALEAERMGTKEVYLLVINADGTLVQAREASLPFEATTKHPELAGSALVDLEAALEATQLVAGMREALMRQQSLAKKPAGPWTWTAEWMSLADVRKLAPPAEETPIERAARLQAAVQTALQTQPGVEVRVTVSPAPAPPPAPKATSKPKPKTSTSGEVWTREPAPAAAPTAASGLTAEAAERVGRAVARAEAPAPSRRGRCRSCNGVFDLDPDWRVHAHLVPGSRRSCEGSGAQVAPEPAEQAAGGAA